MAGASEMTSVSEKQLVLHSLLSGLDILVIIILAVAIISGLTAGLVLKVGQVAAVLAAYVLANLFASQAGVAKEVVFIIAFAVLSIVFRYVVLILKLVDKIPVIGTLDKIGGAILSFVVAFIVVYFAVNLLFHGVPQSILDSWGWTKEAVRKTMFISALLQ